MSGDFWTKEDTVRLLSLLGRPAVEIAHHFPGRSIVSIQSKSKRLKIDAQLTEDAITAIDDELGESVLRIVRAGEHSIADIADELDRGPATIQKSVDDLRAKGYRIELTLENKAHIPRQMITGYTHIPLSDFRDGKWFRFGVVSDTHLCNKHARLDCLNAAYDAFQAEGIREVLHGGNWVDGEARFNKMELIVPPGHDNQVRYFLNNYPKRKGIVTRILSGDDHEGWAAQREGIDVGRHLEMYARAEGREDIINLGYGEADIPFYADGGKRPAILRMSHPKDGSCFDDQTEILTEDGWKFFKDLTRTERVATLNTEEDRFEWQLPHLYTNDHYVGDLIHFESRTVDFMVTPNHRMWTRVSGHRNNRLTHPSMPQKSRAQSPADYYDWGFSTAEEMSSSYCRQKWQLKRGGQHWVGKNPQADTVDVPFVESRNIGSRMRHMGSIHLRDAAELIAWYVTEGHISADAKQLSLCQSERVNPYNHARIVALFAKLGFSPKPRGLDNKDIVVCSRELCLWLLSECGKGSRNKHLPKWLKECTTDIIELVFDTMTAGDGWVNGRGFGYRSISPCLIADYEELAIKLGLGVTNRGEQTSISAVQIFPTINRKPEMVPYNGRVYCVSVPNQTIMVRRKGRACWSANSYALSYKPQRTVESYDGGSKPQMLFIGHYHKAGYFAWRNVHTLLMGCLESQSYFMRGKQLAAHVGFWLIEFQVSNDGSVHRFRQEWTQFFDEGFYRDRYSPGDQPETLVSALPLDAA